MAFTFTVEKQTYHGDHKVVYGTWDADSVTTGELDLSPYFSGKIYHIDLQETSELSTPVVQANKSVIAESMPLDSGTAATIICDSSAKGTFEAVGDAD